MSTAVKRDSLSYARGARTHGRARPPMNYAGYASDANDDFEALGGLGSMRQGADGDLSARIDVSGAVSDTALKK
jgi:hypothetical protein